MSPRSIRHMLSASTAALIFVASIAVPAAQSSIPDSMLAGPQWRLVGPFRAGWGTMAAGIPEQPNVYYFGAAGGGVWKTDSAGATWQPMSDGLESAPVGAIAIAPSDPKTLYVGMGHPEPRYDIAAGDGMYKSTDGGAHWQHAGLQTTRHIGQILIDPQRREHRARRRARPHLRPEPRSRRLPHDRRRRDVEEGALRRQPDRRRRSRRRSRRSEDRLRDDMDRAQLAVAQLLHADRRRGQRDLEIDRRRSDV